MSVVQTAIPSTRIPESVSQLLEDAALDARSVHAGIRLDTDRSPAATKTLLSYSAQSVHLPELFTTDTGRERPPPCTESAGAGGPDLEPDHPWWGPKDTRSAVRYAYSTERFDFVEVWVEPRVERVHIRAIN